MTILPSPRRFTPTSYIHHTVLQADAAGISVVPIRTDGTKQPALERWRTYQKRRPHAIELERWFSGAEPGIAFITGAVSGNLEALDFDCYDTFEAWLRLVERDSILSALYEHLSWGYMEATPAGGKHLLYRCDVIEGNQKLASRPHGDRRKTLIETRGEGGLIIVAPSRGKVHESGKPYILLRGGVSSIRAITTHQRELLFAAARTFDKMPPIDLSSIPPRQPLRLESGVDSPRPGDLFNQQASWEEVLIPHGWQLVRTSGREGYWRRPGKRGLGISATTNHNGHNLLYVFSSSTVFEVEKGYTKFSAYALLNHNGNFTAAASELAELGYATTKER
ncbi:MAG TPA: bifunctional DNA primase/polymerase [Ktedonobacteraceae bacterium]|nr:bifunctional DNA primase/polymerase [Ktedonobacteraceae bacterium]